MRRSLGPANMAEREYRSTHPPDWIKRRRSVAARATNHMPRSLIGIAIILVASSVGAQTCYTFEYTTTAAHAPNSGICSPAIEDASRSPPS
jgi:hypothetical protein